MPQSRAQRRDYASHKPGPLGRLQSKDRNGPSRDCCSVFSLEDVLLAGESNRAFKCPPFRDVFIRSLITAAVENPRM
jgi:hypothetical protein